MALQILETSRVKPLQPTQRFHLPLAFRDSFFLGGPCLKAVLFFSHPPGDFNLQALKHGLSVALVPFYPLAGRLNISEDPNSELTIDCNDAGVDFVEAVIDLAFSDFEEQHFPIRDDLVRELPRNDKASPDCPLLSIQVTRFKGGNGSGLAIGCAMDHVVADGHSVFYFLKSWGECCRGEGVSLPPLHLRSVVEPECWGMEKYARPRFSHADFGSPLDVLMNVVKRSSGEGYCRTMHFDSTVARELKQTAIMESGNPRISTFQGVIACAWKRLCAAQSFPAHREVCIFTPANLRHLLIPTMTDAFFGNAAVLQVTARATVGDLQRESVGLIAARINESMKMVRDQRILRERLGSMEKEVTANIRRQLEEQEPVIEFVVAHGSKLPVFDVDVGLGSTMEAIRPAAFDHASSLMVFRGKEEGSMDISVCLPTQQSLQAFLSISCPCIDF